MPTGVMLYMCLVCVLGQSRNRMTPLLPCSLMTWEEVDEGVISCCFITFVRRHLLVASALHSMNRLFSLSAVVFHFHSTIRSFIVTFILDYKIISTLYVFSLRPLTAPVSGVICSCPHLSTPKSF